MGIQGNKATHDFLSLYAAAAAKDSSLHDSKPPAASQGFFLKTHDFLQPLEKPAPAASGVGRQQQPQQQTKHALPGGIGTFSISPVPGARPVVVKPEPPLVLWGQPTTTHPTAQELAVRVDGKGGSCSGSGTDQRPNTPKSKHSATEQRRRSKINDRFQILRDLLPHTDQKRDKATFLLEVIEYIRFLQEKAQKYEASFPEWNQENAKLLPWSNIYFRSSWKSAQSKGQIPEDALPDPSQFVTNGSSPGFNITGKLDDNHTTVASGAVAGTPDLAENDHMASVSCRSAETPINITNNVTSQYQPQWAGPSGVDDCAVNSSMLNDQQLTIDEGTISVSSQYSQEYVTKNMNITHLVMSFVFDVAISGFFLMLEFRLISLFLFSIMFLSLVSISRNNQVKYFSPFAKSKNIDTFRFLLTHNRLLNTLTHALQSSGIDLSQANISVQINLGKRAVKRSVAGQSSSSKELTDPDPSNEMVAAEELPHATKRHKSGNT